MAVVGNASAKQEPTIKIRLGSILFRPTVDLARGIGDRDRLAFKQLFCEDFVVCSNSPARMA
jgi:hypothetical protein